MNARRPWRVGVSGFNVYDADGRMVGTFISAELAAVAVACVNAQPFGSHVVLDPRCSTCGSPTPPYVVHPEPVQARGEGGNGGSFASTITGACGGGASSDESFGAAAGGRGGSHT